MIDGQVERGAVPIREVYVGLGIALRKSTTLVCSCRETYIVLLNERNHVQLLVTVRVQSCMAASKHQLSLVLLHPI